MVEEDAGGLLCIVTDNMEERRLLLERDAIENATEFRLLAALHGKSEWKVDVTEIPSTNLKQYVAGASIWIRFAAFLDIDKILYHTFTCLSSLGA